MDLYRFSLLLGGLIFYLAIPHAAGGKNSTESFGVGLSVSVPVPEAEVLDAVQDVVADGIIQGSKEYNKDEYISGAEQADGTTAFSKWEGPGRAFYKIRQNAVDPRNFKDAGDSGLLAVRYVVQHGDDKNTILKIDAVYVDDMHRRAHLSNGSVETAEYAAIQDHISAMHLAKQRTTEEEQRQKQEQAARELERNRRARREGLAFMQSPNESLQQYVGRLRREAERRIKSPGTQLKSAPFRSASSITSLSAGERVVILITTPYWYGVETEAGQHGWIHRSQLELLP